MKFFTENQIRDRYRKELKNRLVFSDFSASTILYENRQSAETKKEFDIFLSHSSSDNEIIAGITLLLQDFGYSVYVDWNDPKLNKNNVTPGTAEILRNRMMQSKSLLYVFSENASNSKWMPWELGYFDGLKKSKIAVLPIIQHEQPSFKGTEFVGLYRYVKILDTSRDICICDGDRHVNYSSWIGK